MHFGLSKSKLWSEIFLVVCEEWNGIGHKEVTIKLIIVRRYSTLLLNLVCVRSWKTGRVGDYVGGIQETIRHIILTLVISIF